MKDTSSQSYSWKKSRIRQIENQCKGLRESGKGKKKGKKKKYNREKKKNKRKMIGKKNEGNKENTTGKTTTTRVIGISQWKRGTKNRRKVKKK